MTNKNKLEELKADAAYIKYSATYDAYLAANAKAAIAKDSNTSDRSDEYDTSLAAADACSTARGAWVDFIKAAAAIP